MEKIELIKLVSRVHPSCQMSEGCSRGSQNWPQNTGLTGLKVNQEKMMVGKSVHYKTNPPPPGCMLQVKIKFRLKFFET